MTLLPTPADLGQQAINLGLTCRQIGRTVAGGSIDPEGSGWLSFRVASD